MVFEYVPESKPYAIHQRGALRNCHAYGTLLGKVYQRNKLMAYVMECECDRKELRIYSAISYNVEFDGWLANTFRPYTWIEGYPLDSFVRTASTSQQSWRKK